MANVNNPTGFKPVQNIDGSPYDHRIRAYYVPSSDANNMFIGDLVALAAGSNTSVYKHYKPGELKNAQLATAGATNRILGSIVAVEKPITITDSSINRYRPASTESIIYVAEADKVLYEVQSDEDIVAADIGLNANFAAGSGGNTFTSFSSNQIDSTGIAANATFQFTIMNLVKTVDNELGNYARVIVRCNLPELDTKQAGV